MGNDREWENLNKELGGSQAEDSLNGETPHEPVDDGSGSVELPESVTIDLELDDASNGAVSTGLGPSGRGPMALDASEFGDGGSESSSHLESRQQDADMTGLEQGDRVAGQGDSGVGGAGQDETADSEETAGHDVSEPSEALAQPEMNGAPGTGAPGGKTAGQEETGDPGEEPGAGEAAGGKTAGQEGSSGSEKEPGEGSKDAAAEQPDGLDEVETLEIDLDAVEPVSGKSSPPPLSRPPVPPPPVGGPSAEVAGHVRRDVVNEFRTQVQEGRGWERGLVEGELAALSDKRRKAAYYYELGELEERFFGSESNAAKAYREAVRLRAGLLVNLWAVRRVLSRHGKWKNVLKLINAELKIAEDPAHRRDLLLEKAALQEGTLGDPKGAAETYRLLLEEDPTNLSAIMGLESVAAVSGDSAALIDLARRQIDATASVGRKVALLVELERMLRRSGADYEACRRVLEEAVDLVGPERDFFREWELLAASHERYEDLYEVFERHVAWSLSMGEWVEAVAVARRMARLALERLRDPHRAAQALGLVQSQPEAFAAVARDRLFLAWMTSDWDVILDLTKLLLESETDISDADRLDLEMSRIVALASSGRPKEAHAAFSALVGEKDVIEDPELALFGVVFTAWDGGPEELFHALAALDHIFSSRKGDDGRFRMVTAGLATARAYLRFAMAHAEDGLDETALTEVGGLCKDALMNAPGDPWAFRLYEEVLMRLGDFETLVDLLEARSQQAEGSELTWVLEGVAWACYGPLGNPEKGAKALERLAEGTDDPFMAAFRLAVLSEKHGDPVRAASFWRKVADSAVEAEVRVEALLRSADLVWVHKGDSEQALESLDEILKTAPGDQTALFQIERILTHEGRWEDLAALLRREAGSAPSPEIEERLLLKAADILDLRLDRTADAEDIYRDLVMRFPEQRSAAWLLAHAWRRSGHWEELVDHWADRARSEGDSSGLEEAAKVCEYELGQLDRAEAYYLESFEDKPWDVFLVERLVTLSYGMKNPGQALDVLERFLDVREKGEGDREQLLTEPLVDMLRAEVAMLKEFALEDPASAWERWADLVDEEGLLGRMARWAGLRWAVRSSDWAGRGAYGERLAESLQGLLGEVVALRAAVHRAMADPGAASRKTAIDELGEITRRAAGLLRPLGALGGEHVAERVSTARTDQDRGWALLRVALVSSRNGDWKAAYEAVCSAADILDAEPVVFSVAAQLALRAGNKEAHAVWLARLGLVWVGDETAAESFVAAAKAFESVERVDDALWCWRQALVRYPHRTAFEGLTDLLGRLGRWQQLDEVLSFWIDQEMDAQILASLYSRRGKLREEHLADFMGAAADYHRVLSRDGDDWSVVYRLGVLYARDGNGQRAMELLSRAREQDEDEDLGWMARIAMAEVAERLLEDADQARSLYRDLVDLRDQPDSWERWLGFSVRARNWDDAEEAFSRLGELLTEESDRVRLAIRQALFYRDFVVNREKAARALERARSIRPADMEPVRILLSLYRDMGDKDGLGLVVASALQEQMRLLGSNPFDAALYRNVLELADVAEEPDRKFFAAGALDLLGELSGDDSSWYADQRKQRFSLSKKIGESLWSTLLCRTKVRDAGATEICRAIGYGVARLEGRVPSALGLGRSDKVSMKKASGALKEILDLAERFGVTVEAVYSWDRSGLTWLDGEDGTIIVLGKDWGSRQVGAADLFDIGRKLAAARMRALTLSALPPDKVQLYLVAATSSVVSDYRHDLPSDKVSSLAKTLTKAMARRDRKALALSATTYARRSSRAEDWLSGLALTFDRAGLLLCGDLDVAAREICRRSASPWSGPKDGVQKLRACPDVGELLVYAVSETFAELRRELGMTWKL